MNGGGGRSALTDPATALELLERTLGPTRAALSRITTRDLARPTPCRDWPLARLLQHMDDGLDAFVEASTGAVAMERGSVEVDPGSLCAKAGRLLGIWTDQVQAGRAGAVGVGDLSMGAGLLLSSAALEIAVHGWDVAATLGTTSATLPESLAGDLLDVAQTLVPEHHRDVGFAAALATPAQADATARLLAFLGRRGGSPQKADWTG